MNCASTSVALSNQTKTRPLFQSVAMRWCRGWSMGIITSFGRATVRMNFPMKRQGMSYQDIAASGGGIQHTVRSTAQSSKEDLLKLGYQRMRAALSNGTTHLEAKSGYGLTTESELQLLDVAHELKGIAHLPTMELTWLGAHDTPPGKDRSAVCRRTSFRPVASNLEPGLRPSSGCFL